MALTLDSISVKQELDTADDLSWIGTYTDTWEDHYICTVCGDFLGDHDHLGCYYSPRGWKYFAPYAGGEKPDSKYYREYALQDYNRMVAYNRNDWWMIGIIAEAVVSYQINRHDKRLECFTSCGLWGIESDSDGKYIEQEARNQLDDLKDHLSRFGVDLSNFDGLAEKALAEADL